MRVFLYQKAKYRLYFQFIFILKEAHAYICNITLRNTSFPQYYAVCVLKA